MKGNTKDKYSIVKIIGAVLLHVLGAYLVTFLQEKAYNVCSTSVYILIKLVLRWFYLLVPIGFMLAEHMSLKDIGITKNKIIVQVGLGVVMGGVQAALIVGVTVLLGFQEQLGKAPCEEGWQYIIDFFYKVFGVALWEEVFYRGYIFKKLQDIKESKWFAILISSLIFGMCHIIGYENPLQGIPQVLIAMVVGIFYCLLREKIRNCSLVTLIFMHGVYDFCIGFFVFLL